MNPRHCRGFRLFSASSSSNEPSNPGVERIKSKSFGNKALRIFHLIKRGGNDLESELNRVNVSLSIPSITQILQLLNSEKVSALRFFNWVRDSSPSLSRNYDICSLVVDNCGRLSDYESLTRTLNEFNLKGICLTPNAFRFVPESGSTKDSLKDSVIEVVDMLDGVGGTCRTSGVRSLIEMFSRLGSFEMAKFVMQITETNTSYYNVMIRETCRQCDLESSRALLDEMKQVGCRPNITSYNLVLSNMCKNDESAEDLLKEIQEMDCSPDEITFEILISHSCKLGQFDFALELLDKMMLWGLIPRLTTHAAFVKGYFKLHRYEEARKYVDYSSATHRYSSNVVYSLLAELYLKEGNEADAASILSEMVDKGLRPSFRVFVRLLKGLRRSGRDDESRDLEKRFFCLSPQTITETG